MLTEELHDGALSLTGGMGEKRRRNTGLEETERRRSHAGQVHSQRLAPVGDGAWGGERSVRWEDKEGQTSLFTPPSRMRFARADQRYEKFKGI